MYRKITLFLSIVSFVLLLGCNANAQTIVYSSAQLFEDSEEVFDIINDTGLEKEFLSEYDSMTIEAFMKKYIDNYEKYPDEEELLMKMDQLIQNHKMYFVAVGLEDKEAINRHKTNYNNALTYLNEEFN